MAMNKKEQAAMKEAIDRADLLAALRWTDPVNKDIPAPLYSFKSSDGKRYTEGWDFNAYSKKVYQAWSECVAHGTGPYPVDNKNRHGSQNAISLFSTKLLALKAMRHSVERQAAADLMAIDRLIEKEKGFQ